MADNVVLPGVGDTIAADEVAGVGKVQYMKLMDGTTDSSAAVPATVARGIAVDPRLKIAQITVTPTISTTAYASGDCVGGLMTLANAARASGGSGVLRKMVVLDKTQAQRAPMDLLFFDRSVTAAGDNNPVAFSDADMAFCLGVVPIGPYNTAWPGTPLNSVSTLLNVGFDFVLNGTDLFCQAVVRGTPTYTSTTDLQFLFHIVQD